MNKKIASALALAAVSISILALATPALASPPALNLHSDTDNEGGAPSQSNGDSGMFVFMDGITRSGNVLGDMWGLRPLLGKYGVSFALQETSEVLGNVTGGINRGFDYDGLTQMAVQLDTQRAFGLYGGTFNASALQVHGRNLSADNLGALQTASGIEANRATRLWELWYDQKFLPEDRMDIKIGQQSIDQEFMVSSNALLFVNTMFGWPMLPSADMPGGGPAYPLSAPGVRIQGRPINAITLLAGVYNGTPVDPNGNNNSGTVFPLGDGVLAIAEMQYSYPALGSMVSPGEGDRLSGVYKIGMWYDSENFADQEFDNTGLSLANGGSTGLARNHKGNYAIYGVADQMLWHSDEDLDADRSINFFTRIMGTPLSDRNLVDFSLNAGFVMHEPFEHRDDDTVGIGMGYAHVSSRVAALDNDLTNAGTYTPHQTSETYVEVTYSYQVTPAWHIQPDFQYIFNPGGGIANTDNNRVGNEAIIGVRTVINF